MRLARRDVWAIRRLLDDDARQRLARAAQPDPMDAFRVNSIDRRGTHRDELGVAAEVRRINPGRLGAPVEAGVRDVSRDGLSLWLADELEAGDRLDVTIDAGGRREVVVLCTVRWCRPADGGYAIGCEAGVEWGDSLADLLLPADLPRMSA